MWAIEAVICLITSPREACHGSPIGAQLGTMAPL